MDIKYLNLIIFICFSDQLQKTQIFITVSRQTRNNSWIAYVYIVIYNSVVFKIGEGVYIAIKLQTLRLNEAAPSLLRAPISNYPGSAHVLMRGCVVDPDVHLHHRDEAKTIL